MRDTAEERCTLEEVTMDHGSRQYVLIPEIIFQTDDIILVASGSFSCVRALYRTAAKSRALERFYYEIITPEQYAAGLAEHLIAKQIEKAILSTNAGGIIYYASCMDVVAKTDFEKIKREIRNPYQIPVEVLYRGPMVRRYLDSNKKLTELLMKIPLGMKALKGDGIDLPPMMPDFEAVCGVLQSWKVYRFLLSSGGCDGCISGTGRDGEAYHVTKSRVNDIDIARGCEEKIKNGILWDYRKKGSRGMICITAAGLPKLIGFDYDRVLKEIRETGAESILFPSNGFCFAGQGLSDMYLTLLKKMEHFRKCEEENGRSIGILGGNCFAALQNEEIQEGIGQIKKMGLNIVWPEEDEVEKIVNLTKTQCSWVVSSEGIAAAKWLEKNYNIPYVIGIPINKKMVSVWKEFLASGENGSLKQIGMPAKKYKIDNRPYSRGNILLIGDPAVIGSIGSYLSYISCATVTYAVYSQLPSVKRWYKMTLKDTDSHWIGHQDFTENIHYFKNKEELASLTADADIIFGELLFKMAFTEKELFHKKWIDLPMPILNCGIRNDRSQYFLFGARGVRWINGNIDIKKLKSL